MIRHVFPWFLTLACSSEPQPAAPPAAAEVQAPAAIGEVDVAAAFELLEQVRNRPPAALQWLDAASYAVLGRPPGAAESERPRLYRVGVESGAWTPLYDALALHEALATQGEIGADAAAELASRSGHELWRGADGAAVGLLVQHEGRWYAWNWDASAVQRVAGPDFAGAAPEHAQAAPDGSRLAFVRGNDLYVAPLRAPAEGEPAEQRLTSDGGPERLNGVLDWVYQEEIYGRGQWRAFWWSPDSTRLAFLQLDESPVREFRVEDHIPAYGKQEIWRYPKAGEANPGVEVGVAAAGGGPLAWVDLARWPAADRLVMRVDWTPEGDAVALQICNRIQNQLDLVFADPAGGAPRVVLSEKSASWVQPSPLHWLPDGSFLWESTRNGRKHLYRYRRDGTQLGALTAGEFQVASVVGVDAAAGVVYLLSDEGERLQQHLWRVPLDLSPRTRITQGRGTHQVELAPGWRYFIDTWSHAEDPGATELRRLDDGGLVRELSRGDRERLLASGFQAPRFVQVRNREGQPLEARYLPARGLKPGQRAPVLIYQYSGPESPMVRDSFGGRNELWHQALARAGILVWSCDPRSASGKAQADAAIAYRRLGETELRDLEDGLDWLLQEGLADPARVAIWGWSYGGYMASYALTHSTRFRLGIAGAPVTDWRNYDTVYTERYMSTPQDNPEGYRASSVVEAAGRLHGELLLIHGTIDENVHLANTLQLAYALQEAGKPFRMMLYPRNRHGVVDPEQRLHLYRMMTEFLREEL